MAVIMAKGLLRLAPTTAAGVDMVATTERGLLMLRLPPTTAAGVDTVATTERGLLMPRLPPTMAAGVDMVATTERGLLMLRLPPTTAGVDMAMDGASNFYSHPANSLQIIGNRNFAQLQFFKINKIN